VSTGEFGAQLGPATGVTPGGLGKRAAARFIDWILAYLVGGIIFFVLDKTTSTPEWLSVLPGAGFGFLYFLGFEVASGSTPGKKILGLHVNGSGSAPKPSLKDSALRNAYMLLAIIPWIGGVFWFIAAVGIAVTITTSSTKQGWHDRFANGTQVVEQ